jgi:two-component system, NtrC family, sensor kinase
MLGITLVALDFGQYKARCSEYQRLFPLFMGLFFFRQSASAIRPNPKGVLNPNAKHHYLYLRCSLGLLTCIVSLAAYVSYQSLRQAMLANLKHNAMLAVEGQTLEIGHWLGSLKIQVDMLAHSDAVSSGEWRLANRYLYTEHQRLKDFAAIGLAEVSGTRYSTVAKPIYVGDREWFKSAMAGETLVHDAIISRANGRPSIPISAPIPNQDNPQAPPKGVILGSVDLDHVQAVTQKLKFGQGSYNFVLDSQGKALIHPNANWLSTVDKPAPSLTQSGDPDLAEAAKRMQAKQSNIEEMTIDNQPVYVAFAPLKNANWSIALVIPKATLESQLRVLDGIAIAGLILVSGLVVLLLYTKSAEKTRDKQLAAEAHQVILEQQITERTQALNDTLHQLQESQLQLVQSEKMSALGNLVAGVAHEINNPLGFLVGNLKPAQDYINGMFQIIDLYQAEYHNATPTIQAAIVDLDLEYIRQDLPQLMQSMHKGADRISSISNSLRTFSRADSESAVSFNLHEGLDSTLLILKHRLKASEVRPEIQVVLDYGNLPEVKCYAGQLNQVFMNIIANAIDALEESITAQANPHQPLQIHVTTGTQNESVWVKICDNGLGMPASIQQRIFDHLFTTKAVGKGTGLGLAISHQIITKKHNGTITVDSQIGVGTTFTITLPI